MFANGEKHFKDTKFRSSSHLSQDMTEIFLYISTQHLLLIYKYINTHGHKIWWIFLEITRIILLHSSATIEYGGNIS